MSGFEVLVESHSAVMNRTQCSTSYTVCLFHRRGSLAIPSLKKHYDYYVGILCETSNNTDKKNKNKNKSLFLACSQTQTKISFSFDF